MGTSTSTILIFLENKPFLGRQISQIPFFEVLRKTFQDITIVCIAPNDASARFLKELGYINHLITYQSYKNNLLKLWKLVSDLKQLSPSHIFQLRRQSLRCNTLARLSGKNTIGFHSKIGSLLHDTVSFSNNEYISFNYLKLLHKDNIELDVTVKRENYCLIIPVAGREEKIYNIHNFIKLADKIGKTYPVKFVTQSQFSEIKTALEPYSGKYDVLTDLTIPALRDVILRSKYVISNDCGPVHFAHIYDIPRIVLYKDAGDAIGGPVDLWFRQTESSRKIISQTGNINDIPIETVLQNFVELSS